MGDTARIEELLKWPLYGAHSLQLFYVLSTDLGSL